MTGRGKNPGDVLVAVANDSKTELHLFNCISVAVLCGNISLLEEDLEETSADHVHGLSQPSEHLRETHQNGTLVLVVSPFHYCQATPVTNSFMCKYVK